MASRFLSAEWRKLAIANFAVDPHVLRPFLPHKTELDLWNGQCYLSLVGFMFMNTRLKGIRIPFHQHFEEVNLRFYVRYKEGGEWKRGVTFIREIVPRRALAIVANTIYKEKYITLAMRHDWDITSDRIRVSYEWKYAQLWNRFSVEALPHLQDIPPGSEEEFITEHYWGYTPLGEGVCSEYGVEHPRWQIYPVTTHDIAVDFHRVYGRDFAFLDSRQPDSVMLAEGSEIVVRSMLKIR